MSSVKKTHSAVAVESFSRTCPFFTSNTDDNNGYGCTHNWQKDREKATDGKMHETIKTNEDVIKSLTRSQFASFLAQWATYHSDWMSNVEDLEEWLRSPEDGTLKDIFDIAINI
jgi:hypothetical protein